MKKQSSKRPIIGISASQLVIDSGSFRGRKRAFVGQDYIQAIAQAGGTPIVLPILTNLSLIEQQMALVDGLLLSGGYDVQPLLYGEEPLSLLNDVLPERDEHEMQLAKLCVQAGKPLLGICRGLQLLNVAFGGTLYQDVSYYPSSTLQHNQQAPPQNGTHTVEIMEGSLLKDILGTTSLSTNSYHHQAVKEMAPGFVVNARSKDGLIEGMEAKDRSFVLCVQWHPELMFEQRPDMFKLFQSFVAASLSRMA